MSDGKIALNKMDTTINLDDEAVKDDDSVESDSNHLPTEEIPEFRSMENIMLESTTSFADLLNTGTDVQPESVATRVIDEVPEKESDNLETEAAVSSASTHDADPLDDETVHDNVDLSSYFDLETDSKLPTEVKTLTFFDTIEADAETGKTAGNSEHVEHSSADVHGSERRQRTESSSSQGGVVQEQAIPVEFEQSKGVGPMKFVGSTRSLNKFFSEDSGGNDLEGKSFFESFTIGGSGNANTTQSIPSPSIVDADTVRHGDTSPSSPELPELNEPSLHLQADNTIPESPPADMAIENSEEPKDTFSLSLNMSDTDRRNDAWLPTETTRQTLHAIATSPDGTYSPEPEQLTMPGLVIDDPQGDPVKELMHKCLGEQAANSRVTLTADSVSQDITGLQHLIDGDCLRAAVDLSGRLLESLGQGTSKLNQPSTHTPHTLQVWFIRFSLLMKLRLYSHAESEFAAFGNLDRPDLYYDYYPHVYPGRRGTIVPFSMRVLHAELPQYLGKAQEALDRLYYIHAITKKIITNLEAGLAEDGSNLNISQESHMASRTLWELRKKKKVPTATLR